MQGRWLVGGIVGAAIATLAQQALGAAFFIQEQSIAGMGRAYAGESAVADTAATIFFNPAGLTLLDRPQVHGAGYAIIPSASFEDRGTVARTPATFGAFRRVQGNDGGNPYGPTPFGNFYASMPVLEDRVWLGFGVTAPYGLLIVYNSRWFGRYDSTKSRLQTYNFAPTVAVKATDWLSFGLSLNIEYARATLRNALPNPTTPGGPTAPGDGRATVKGDDTSVGFTLGALTQPFERARLGVAWRWGISHELDGTLDITGLKGILKVANEHVGGSADLDLPQAVMIGGLYELSDSVRLLGQFNWYGWSSFEEIRVVTDSGPPPPVQPQHFENTIGLAGGLEWKVLDNLRLRGGFQYDQTPTVDRFRNTRIPDADRYLLGVGFTYDLNDDISATFGYMHVFVKEATFDRAQTIYPGTPLATRYRFVADASAMVNIVGAGFTYRF
jgi:long-chain fatty acid transport protein